MTRVKMKIMTADFPPNRGKAKEPSDRVVIAAVDEWVNEEWTYTWPGHLCGPTQIAASLA